MQQQPAYVPVEQAVGLPPEVKDLRIMRQTAIKCAVQFIPHLPDEERTLYHLEQVAESFLRYFQSGPQARPVGVQEGLPESDPWHPSNTNPGPVQDGGDGELPPGFGDPETEAPPYTGGFPTTGGSEDAR